MSEDQKTLIVGNWDYSPYVDLELVWGAEFRNVLGEFGHMTVDKILPCGAFAFDPYFAPGFQRNRNRKKTILFATGFSTADSRPEYCETGLPEGSAYHGKLYELHREARDKWLTTIKKLHNEIGDEWLFELKVRPGEMENEYRRELGDTVKIHPQKASSSDVLRNVDLLIHSGSTMAIEAHLLGIPSFNYHNVNPDPLISGVSHSVETHNELARLIGKVDINKTNIHLAVLRLLEDCLYGTIDGQACRRAAGFIHEHLLGKEIKTDIPNTWPKEALYLTDDVHLEKQEGDYRWTCPCCRNVYYAEQVGIRNCPYCNMQIERTIHDPDKPARKTLEAVPK
jgi:hypothetical protein